MQNAETCDVHRLIVSAPFAILELHEDAVFEPFTLNRWTWKGRASSKLEALRTDVAYRVHAVRYDPAQGDMIAHRVDELGREVLVFNRTTLFRMLFGSSDAVAWASEIKASGRSQRLRRWLRRWLSNDDADAVERDWVPLIERAAQRA
ncbi:hypothetical protein CA235_02455 [Sphingomonas sp. ABOLF]|uniref:hypothetical protein n=1 Tax=Sphingomonas sp. ABOLF TaxID=1985879 RepID=UPI000F7E78EA|nr:hypothetical protein [Sphingomonas sp. ABOLF]RSV17507.1 hypothetical protein CA235_02455 [Sphingomonas sp. ABOLF]